MDKVSVEQLREWVGVESIEATHESLLNEYYEKTLVKGNPLLHELFSSYEVFKKRRLVSEELAVGPMGIVDMEKLESIKYYNFKKNKILSFFLLHS